MKTLIKTKPLRVTVFGSCMPNHKKKKIWEAKTPNPINQTYIYTRNILITNVRANVCMIRILFVSKLFDESNAEKFNVVQRWFATDRFLWVISDVWIFQIISLIKYYKNIAFPLFHNFCFPSLFRLTSKLA